MPNSGIIGDKTTSYKIGDRVTYIDKYVSESGQLYFRRKRGYIIQIKKSSGNEEEGFVFVVNENPKAKSGRRFHESQIEDGNIEPESIEQPINIVLNQDLKFFWKFVKILPEGH